MREEDKRGLVVVSPLDPLSLMLWVVVDLLPSLPVPVGLEKRREEEEAISDRFWKKDSSFWVLDFRAWPKPWVDISKSSRNWLRIASEYSLSCFV